MPWELNLFEDKGLSYIHEENMTVVGKEIVGECLQLNKVDALHYDMEIDVLTPQTNLSILDFVKLFYILLQQIKEKALDVDACEGRTLEQVKAIMTKAVDANHCVCTVSKWYINKKTT